MSHRAIQKRIERELTAIFGEVETWFDRPVELLHFQPETGWTIAEVLEHITLTNRFLLLTLNKQAKVALHRSNRGDEVPVEVSNLDTLESIGVRGSFEWNRPDHMEPSGEAPVAEIRQTLQEQLSECLGLLPLLGDGVGRLVRISMSVNGLGKIDLNQWLYFIGLHAQRHLDQLACIEAEARRCN